MLNIPKKHKPLITINYNKKDKSNNKHDNKNYINQLSALISMLIKQISLSPPPLLTPSQVPFVPSTCLTIFYGFLLVFFCRFLTLFSIYGIYIYIFLLYTRQQMASIKSARQLIQRQTTTTIR